MKKLKIEDKVMIYEDPVTKQKPEGMARITSRVQDHGEYWRCKVLFDADLKDGYAMSVWRKIWKS